MKKTNTILLFLVFSLLFFNAVNGEQMLPPKKLFFHHLSSNLTSGSVYCMLQDKQGFIWFCTADGLSRYDGYDIVTYRHDPTDSLSRPSGRVACMLEDKNEVIWMGTYQGGLVSFDKITKKFHAYKYIKGDSTSLSNNSIFCLYLDKTGIFWMGSLRGDLNSFDPKTKIFHSYKSDSSAASFNGIYQISGIAEDNNGMLWISTYYGLCAFDRKTGKSDWIIHKKDDINTPGNNRLLDIYKDHKGKLWITNLFGDLDEFDPATRQFIHHKNEIFGIDTLNPNIVQCMWQDHNDRYWFGTIKGLFVYDKTDGSFNSYHHDLTDSTTMEEDRVISIMEDASGILWLGGEDAGVDYTTMKSERFALFTPNPAEIKTGNEKFVFYIYEDHENTLWLGGYTSGLCTLDKKAGYFSHYANDPVMKESRGSMKAITFITEDNDETLWIATNGNGLYAMNKRTGAFKHFVNDGKIQHAIKNNLIISLSNQDSNILWTGNYGGGLNMLDKKTGFFTTYLNDTADVNVKGKDNIFCILADTGNYLWLGTGGGGLNLFNKKTGKFKAYLNDPQDAQSLSGNIIYSLYKDQKGILWVGTAEGGLNAFNQLTKKFTRYTEKDGLANNTVVGILPDDKGNLWCSTQKGLTRFTPPKVLPVDGSKGNFTMQSYDEHDGLSSGFQTGPYWKGKDGYLYFGGEAGVNAFHPDSVKNNTFIPPVVLTSFKIFEKEFPLDTAINFKKTITLSYKDNFFSFEFAALNFLFPEKNKFLYKLEGFNDNWIDPGKRRYASFTNLDPGRYTFRVKASNNDGIWNDAGTFITIIITPPFWKTWWFITLCFLSGACILYLIYRNRINQLLQLQHIRNKIASDLHDDVGSTLSSISIFSELAKEQNSDVGHLLDQIGDSSRKMLDAMADIVWTINPENDQFEKIILRMRSFAYELLGAKKIDFEFEADENVSRLKLPMDVRKNLYLIFKEATNNMVKYADASKASFQISGTKENLIMLIRDNGKGFIKNNDSLGNGLRNMKKRAEEIGATLLIESEPGTGTTIQLLLNHIL